MAVNIRSLINIEQYSLKNQLQVNSVLKIAKRKKIDLVKVDDTFYFRENDMDSAVATYFNNKFNLIEKKRNVLKVRRQSELNNKKIVEAINEIKRLLNFIEDTEKKTSFINAYQNAIELEDFIYLVEEIRNVI
jgi:hypothetical protein